MHVARMGRSKICTGFRWGNLKGEKRENLGIDGKIILKSVLNKLGGRGVNYLAKNRDKWRDFVKITCRLHKMRAIYGLAEKPLAFEGGLCFVGLVKNGPR